MILGLFLTAVVGYAAWNNLSKIANPVRETHFKDPYLPVEADISDHITRNTPFGFVPGRVLGKLEYANPMPLIVRNEFSDSLNETSWGYAAPIGSPSINVEGYRMLLDEKFNIEEHPRLDPTRMDFCKGKHRRSQYAFIDHSQ